MRKKMKTIYNHDGIVVKYEPEKRLNPYRIYRRYNGRTRKLTEYGDLISAICCLKEMYIDAADTMTFDQQREWMKGRTK